MGIENLATFALAAIALITVPGIDTFYIMNHSITQGKKTGVYSAFGICCGIFVHTSVAAFGLSAIIAASAMLYSIVKYVGAAYLIYLGIKALVTKNTFNLGESIETVEKKSKWEVFKKGIMVNVLNPKPALFFLSFFPQFVKPSYADAFYPFYILGGLFFLMAITWCLFLAISASSVSSYIRKHPRFQTIIQKFSGLVFIAFGVKVALEKDSNTTTANKRAKRAQNNLTF